MTRKSLSLRFLLRDFRIIELRVVLFALMLAVAAVTSIHFYVDRLNRAFDEQGAELLGGERVINSPTPLPDEWLKLAHHLGLRTGKLVLFSSVATSKSTLQLITVKAATPHYPLLGELRTQGYEQNSTALTKTLPPRGSAWVEPRLQDLMSLQLGSNLVIGRGKFTITRWLIQQPDPSLSWWNASPTVLINADDLPKTALETAGSRMNYRLLLTGSPTQLQRFEKQIQLQGSQRMLTIQDAIGSFKNNLNRIHDYLQWIVISCVVLAGIAIASASRSYAEHHTQTVAVLRCLGATQSLILKWIVLQLSVVGLLGSLLGCGLGFAIQSLLSILFSNWFNFALPAPHWHTVALGFSSGFLILFGFALPRFLDLRRVAVLSILRADKQALSHSGLLTYSLSLGALLLLLIIITQNSSLTLFLAGILLLMAAPLYGIAFISILALSSLRGYLHQVSWRMALNSLRRYHHTTAIQLAAFIAVIAVGLLLQMLRTDILNAWQAQLPQDAPNYFAINIQPDELIPVKQWFEKQNIRSQQFYPMVRGRLLELNHQPILQAIPESARGHNALHRELNLSWSSALPSGNETASGVFWKTQPHTPQISIEQGLAETLGIRLGDQLTFQIAEQTITGQVEHIRKVHWDSFQPNFYIFFSPGVFNQMPMTYITSFYVPAEHVTQINRLIRQFPSVTLFDVKQILQQLRHLISRASLAMLCLMILGIIASFMVLYTLLRLRLSERCHETAILRVLGATQQQLRTAILIEFACLGGLASIMASILSVSIAMIVTQHWLAIPYHLHVMNLIGGTITASSFILLGGWFSVRSVLQHSPMRVLTNIN